MKKALLCLTLIIGFLAVGTAFAQLTPEGRIIGRITDEQGTALPGVTVEATGPKLVGKASTVSDLNGTYRLMALPSGTFEITYTLPGFKTLIRKGIVLELSQTLVLNITLEQAAVEEQVTVVGQSPLIDVKSTVKGMTMTKEIFLSLPRGRSFDSLISTIPGVQDESITAGISVDGASGAENVWYADGADVTNLHYGTKGQNVVLELLDEVKVTASGYNAEYGGSLGGVINIITRSGGNEFHGDIMGFYENNRTWMQGKSRTFLRRDVFGAYVWEYVNYDDLYFNGGKDRDRYYRLEGVFSLGGYIIKDRLWFFGSLNPAYDRTAAQRDFNYREGPFSEFNEKNYTYNGSIRISAAPFTGFRLSASYINNFSKYRGAVPSIIGDEDSTYEWPKEGLDYPNWTGSLTADYTIGNNLLLSYRGGWHQENEKNQQIVPPDASTYVFYTANDIYASDPFFVTHPDLVHTTNWASYGGDYIEVKKYLIEKISNNFDVSYYLNFAGEHAFKAGIGYNYLREDVFDGSTHPRVMIYWGETTNDLDFNIGPEADPVNNPGDVYGKYGFYLVRGSFTSPYGGVWKVTSNNVSLYVQDSWTIKNRLTLNLGVRAESQYMPAFTDNKEYEGWTKNPVKFNLGQTLAPRLGVTYDVFGDSSLKIFASFGIYYDVMKLYMGELTFGGWKRVEDYYALNNPDWTAIASNGNLDDANNQAANGTNTYCGSMDYLPPSLNRVDPDLKPMSQREISFGAEKKLSEDLSFSARFVQKHLIRTIEDVGVYVREGSILYQDFWITNPGFGVSRPVSEGGEFDPYYWRCPKATREYYGLNLSLDKRFSNNWQGGVNYTLSRVSGNYSGLASSDEAAPGGFGRVGPAVEQDFDRWFMGYDGQGNVLDGPLPQDRTHYFKAYGAYSFPFGLTVGVIGYGRSGLPLTTKVLYNSKYFYVNGREDLGRLPFTFWADVYLDYALKFGGKYRASINLQINNVTDTDTIQSKITNANVRTFTGYHDQILDGTFAQNYQAFIESRGLTHPSFNEWATRFGPWSARLGFKFSF
jgi:hypothetical protein